MLTGCGKKADQAKASQTHAQKQVTNTDRSEVQRSAAPQLPAAEPSMQQTSVFCYANDGYIWVTDLAGSFKRKLAAGDEPQISPDRTSVVYSNPAGGVSLVGIAGGPARALSLNASAPQWSPNQTRIAFVREGWVCCMNADGGDQRRLVEHFAGATRPQWMPDSESLFCSTKREAAARIVLVSLSTGAIADVCSGHSFAVAPNGNLIAVLASLHPVETDTTHKEAVLIHNRETKETQCVFTLESDPTTDYLSCPVWSPGGDSLAFVSKLSIKVGENWWSNFYDIHVLTLPGYSHRSFFLEDAEQREAMKTLRMFPQPLLIWGLAWSPDTDGFLVAAVEPVLMVGEQKGLMYPGLEALRPSEADERLMENDKLFSINTSHTAQVPSRLLCSGHAPSMQAGCSVHFPCLSTTTRTYSKRDAPDPNGGTFDLVKSPALVSVHPGSFTMGNWEGTSRHWSCEEPQTEVTLTYGFWIGKYEVTQREYVALMGKNPSRFHSSKLSHFC